MRRQKQRWVVAGLTVALVAVFVVWPRPERITLENVYSRASSGMSRTEIEAIYGPPGDYSTGPLSVVGPTLHRPPTFLATA
jgi:hypothetical protein